MCPPELQQMRGGVCGLSGIDVIKQTANSPMQFYTKQLKYSFVFRFLYIRI